MDGVNTEMKIKQVASWSLFAFVGIVLVVCVCAVWPECPKDMPATIASDSFFGFKLGDECEASLWESRRRHGQIGPHGERCDTLRVQGLPAGLDTLTVGYTPKSARLCCLTALKSYEPNVTDAEVMADLVTLYDVVGVAFSNGVVRNPSFDLHNPPCALYASVENASLRLTIRASRRPDAICNWSELHVENEELLEVADRECRELQEEGRDPFVRSEAEKRVGMLLSWGSAIMFVLAGALLPFVLSLVLQGVVCKLKHLHMFVVLSWWDVLAIALVPILWGLLEHVGESKSLSNLIEFPIIGLIWGACYATRTVLVCRANSPKTWRGGLITLVVLSVTTALMSIFFPGLPE